MDFIAILLLNFSLEAGIIKNDMNAVAMEHSAYTKQGVYLTLDNTPFTVYGTHMRTHEFNYSSDAMNVSDGKTLLSAGLSIDAEELQISVEQSWNMDNIDNSQTKVFINIDTRK